MVSAMSCLSSMRSELSLGHPPLQELGDNVVELVRMLELGMKSAVSDGIEPRAGRHGIALDGLLERQHLVLATADEQCWHRHLGQQRLQVGHVHGIAAKLGIGAILPLAGLEQ